MKRLLLFCVLLFFPIIAHANIFWMSSMDIQGQDTAGGLEYSRITSGGATASSMQMESTVVHDCSNGGPCRSGGGNELAHWAAQANITTGTWGNYFVIASPGTPYYSTALPNSSGYLNISWAQSVHIGTYPSAGKERIIGGILEAGSTTSLGCFITINNNQQLSLYYGNASLASFNGSCTADNQCNGAGQVCAGGECRDFFGTSALTIPVHACSTAKQTGCSADADCPNSGTCSLNYWAGIKINEVVNSASQVTCELYVDGLPIFTGVSMSGGVGPSTNIAFGGIPGNASGNTSTYSNGSRDFTGLVNAYFGDMVLADPSDGTDVGFGYVAYKVPASTGGLLAQWTIESCGVGATADKCVDDYSISPFSYSTGSLSSDMLDSSHVGYTEQFFSSSNSDMVLGVGENVSAVETVITGLTSNGSATRSLHAGTLVCHTGGCDYARCTCSSNDQCGTGGTCTNGFCTTGPGSSCSTSGSTACAVAAGKTCVKMCPGVQTSTCSNDMQCCVATNGADQIITTTSISSPTILYRWLQTQSPTTYDIGWNKHVNSIGSTFTVGVGNGGLIRVGAVAEQIRVAKSPPLSPITLKDHQVAGAPCTSDSQCGNVAGACSMATHKCTNNQDGMCTIWAMGDSLLGGTLEATCVGGSLNGESCSQQTYCHSTQWDATTFKDKPAGGCGAVSTAPGNVCQSCYNRRDDFNNGAGYACSVDTDCALGTCSGGFCTGNAAVSCAVDADCALGSCDSSAFCCDSCSSSCTNDGGTCPSGVVGWAAPLQTRVRVDNIVSCGLGGEDATQMSIDRFPLALIGQSSALAQGACYLAQGTSRCYCSQNSDCGTSGVCGADGTCSSGDFIHLNCQQANDCSPFTCALPFPDYVVSMEGVNSTLLSSIFETNFDDPECRLSLQSSTSNQSNMCPQWGTTGYGCSITTCSTGSECSGVSPNSLCSGRCVGIDHGCNSNVECGLHGPCTIQSGRCNIDSDCPAVVGQTGTQTCVGGTGAGMYNGQCQCSDNSQCLSGYYCVGPSGNRVCRLGCTTAGTQDVCGAQSFCRTESTVPSGSHNVCDGRCTCPCDAVSCLSNGLPSDGLCTSGVQFGVSTNSVVSARNAGNPFQMQGLCNPDSGKCTSCGAIRTAVKEELDGPCSCATNADCGNSGVCDSVKKVCTSSSDPYKTQCRIDSDCFPDHRCLSRYKPASRQYSNYDWATYRAFQSMQKRVDALNLGSNAPVLIFSGIPNMGGMTNLFPPFIYDVDGALPWDRAQSVKLIGQLKHAPWLPLRHVVDTYYFNINVTQFPYHHDRVHLITQGAGKQADAIGIALNRLNVCLKPYVSTSCTVDDDCPYGICNSGTCNGMPDAQKYCLHSNLITWSQRCTCTGGTPASPAADTADCGTGGQCNGTVCVAGTSTHTTCGSNADCNVGGGKVCLPSICNSTSDCLADERCYLRRCDGLESNCPDANDTCGPD